MTATVPVFVNDRAVRVAADTSVAAAIETCDAELGRALAAGSARVTDGRGIPLDPASAVYPGAILRVVVSARKGQGGADADA